MLNKYGFVNGGPNQNPEARFWWSTVYNTMSHITYSKYLETKTARHHASAFERNEALVKELKDIMKTL